MFKNIWYTLLSMFTVFKHLFKCPVTLEYPEKKKGVNEEFRGKLTVSGCVRCGTCTKVCPSGAITISENEFKIDLKKCIFCGNCTFYCPVKAIKTTKEYELATNDGNKLELVYQINKEEGDNERNG